MSPVSYRWHLSALQVETGVQCDTHNAIKCKCCGTPKEVEVKVSEELLSALLMSNASCFLSHKASRLS